MFHLDLRFVTTFIVALFVVVTAQTTGKRPLTQSDYDRYQQLPKFSHALAKQAPWKNNSYTGKMNLREGLFQQNAPIKSQGSCGSCVTNAVVTALEYVVKSDLMLNKNFNFSKYPISLSVTQALACVGQGCDGAYPSDIMDRMISQNTKIILANENMGTEGSGACVPTESYVSLKSFAAIDGANVKAAINSGLPVIATIATGKPNWQCNSEPLDEDYHIEQLDYIDKDGPDGYCNTFGPWTNHCVLIIGYDDNDNGGVWIIQNSWGNRHGGDGIFRLKYGKLNIGEYFVITGVSESDQFVNSIRNDWCIQSTSGSIVTIGGYNAINTVVTTKTAPWTFGSAINTSLPTLPVRKRYGTRYEVTMTIEIPQNVDVTLLDQETNGVSAKIETNKAPWSQIVFRNVTDDAGKTHRVADLKTFTYYVIDQVLGGEYFYWPSKPSEVKFKLQTTNWDNCGLASELELKNYIKSTVKPDMQFARVMPSVNGTFATTTPLLVGTTQVTEEQYIAVIGKFPFTNYRGVANLALPAENVSLYDAALFCNAKSKMDKLDTTFTFSKETFDPSTGVCTSLENLTVNPLKTGYRLPTWPEWGILYLGGTSISTNNGYYWPTTGVATSYAWYSANAGGLPHAVGLKLPNGFGLYDMAGNINSWLWMDGSHSYYNAGGYFSSDKSGLGCTTENSLLTCPKGWAASIVGFRVVRKPNTDITPILNLLLGD